MATPQQNSTFIDGNLDACLSLLNLPESPILPLKRQQRQQHQQHQQQPQTTAAVARQNIQKYNETNNDNKQVAFAYEERLVDVPRTTTTTTTTTAISTAAAATTTTTCKNKHGISNGRRHRSVSLYGVNSTVDQGDKEIPIWLDDDEPRYVSGVTNKTTCNDIIKALIDDQLRNGDFYNNNNDNNNKNNNCNNNNNKKKNRDGGGIAAVAASRDYNDYVITESWRGIERSYDGNMAILPVWRAWSRVHNELRLTMKPRGQLREPLPMRRVQNSHTRRFSFIKWLKQIFRSTKKTEKISKTTAKQPQQQQEQGEREQHNCNSKNNNKIKEKCLLPLKSSIPDEFVLIIMPDQLYEYPPSSPKRKGINAKLNKTQEEEEENKQQQLERRRRRRRQRLKHRNSRVLTTLSQAPAITTTNINYPTINNDNNCIRRRRKDAQLRSSVRNKLAAMYVAMNARFDRETELTRQLSEKCKRYREQNDRYKTSEMELSVGQLQQNIEAYADDIIKTEHELLEIKNEIRQDISLINNLKRMTMEDRDAVNACGVPIALPPPVPSITTTTTTTTQVAQINANANENLNLNPNIIEMQFVDNIYEFCDNNASVIV